MTSEERNGENWLGIERKTFCPEQVIKLHVSISKTTSKEDQNNAEDLI